MQPGAEFKRGQIIRLTTPYWGAGRGLYTVDFVYRNGSLCLLALADGRRYDAPGRLCRLVGEHNGQMNGRA